MAAILVENAHHSLRVEVVSTVPCRNKIHIFSASLLFIITMWDGFHRTRFKKNISSPRSPHSTTVSPGAYTRAFSFRPSSSRKPG